MIDEFLAMSAQCFALTSIVSDASIDCYLERLNDLYKRPQSQAFDV